MSNRKATPDVLGAVLGGPAESITSPAAPATASSASSAAAVSAAVSAAASATAASASEKAAQWEYCEVIFRDYRGWRARLVNGVELGDWKSSPTIVEYLEQAGREGWELVSMGDRHNNHKEAYFKRPK